MVKRLQLSGSLSALVAFSVSTACDPDDDEPQTDGAEEVGDAPEEPLQAEIDRLFPFNPNAMLDAVYLCGRQGSNLSWYFALESTGRLTVAFTTDTSQDFAFEGQYTYADGTITLQMPAGLDQPFPAGLDETSTFIFEDFGMIAGFTTDMMACVAIGHGENPPSEPMFTVHYSCPTIRVQAATDESNGFDVVHAAAPFSTPIPGSIFRQRDIYIAGVDQPNITRGYGLYRRVDDRFYATFEHVARFAAAAPELAALLPNFAAPFDDVNLLSGEFVAQGILVDQLDPAAGPCVQQ